MEELVKACSEMSKTKTGALISIEQGHSLSDFIKTGTAMNSVVSSELLCSIFNMEPRCMMELLLYRE